MSNNAFAQFDRSVDDKLEDSLAGHAAAGHHLGDDVEHAGGGKCHFKVYGADWCGWTQKQKAELQEHNIHHDFIDCTKDEHKAQCADITGFPTIEHNGKKHPGFKPHQALQQLCHSS